MIRQINNTANHILKASISLAAAIGIGLPNPWILSIAAFGIHQKDSRFDFQQNAQGSKSDLDALVEALTQQFFQL